MLVGILEVVRTLDRDAQSAYRIGSGKPSGKRKESKEGLLFSIRPKESREGGLSACRIAPSMTGV